MKLYRRFVADRAVRTHLIVVSTPSLAFCARLVEAHEPVRVQTLRSEFAVERFDEGVISRLSWPAEVERDVLHVRPEIELLANELGSIVDPDRPRVTKFCGAAFQRIDN